jgi:hypothetical protein
LSFLIISVFLMSIFFEWVHPIFCFFFHGVHFILLLHQMSCFIPFLFSWSNNICWHPTMSYQPLTTLLELYEAINRYNKLYSSPGLKLTASAKPGTLSIRYMVVFFLIHGDHLGAHWYNFLMDMLSSISNCGSMVRG